jgi:hypothetical protein
MSSNTTTNTTSSNPIPTDPTPTDLTPSSPTPPNPTHHASLAPLLTNYSILITRLDDLLWILINVRLESPYEDMPGPVLEKTRDDLQTARGQYVEAVTYWKERGKKGEKLDESFERIVRVEMEECEGLVGRVIERLRGEEKCLNVIAPEGLVRED